MIITLMQSGVLREEKETMYNQLNLQLDTDGLLKCQGRLGNAELTKAAKQPKLLPKDAY